MESEFIDEDVKWREYCGDVGQGPKLQCCWKCWVQYWWYSWL